MQVNYTKPGYGRIVIAGFIDAVLIIVFFGFFLNTFAFIPIIQANANYCLFIGFILYRILTISLFNSTFGMKVLGLIFLNQDEEVLSLKEKFLASFFILFEGVDYFRQGRNYT